MQDGRILCAEPWSKCCRGSRFDNIFMLPHIGSATRQTRDAMGFRALDNLDAFFAGNTPGDRL